MVEPIHPDHVQPSDVGEILPFASTDRISASRPDISVAGVVHRYEVPANGILENPYFVQQDNGSAAGPSTMDLQKNGVTMLTGLMSIEHDDTDLEKVTGVFLAAGGAVVRGDVITLVASVGATNQLGATTGYDYRLLGR